MDITILSEQQHTVPLGKIAKIIRPSFTAQRREVTILRAREWRYPICYEELSTGRETSCVLQKGDILLINRENVMLVYEQPSKEIYASTSVFVIRVEHEAFCPEYVYEYLAKSEAGGILLESLQSAHGLMVDRRALAELPVAFPEKDEAYYWEKFYSENFPYRYIKEHRLLESAEDKQTESTDGQRVIPYEGEKLYVFISYAHKDKERVLPILRKLSEAGYRLWYDEGIDPGTEWDKNIAEHIVNCGYFIAFMSENYLASSNCKDELNYARDLDKNRFLVYLEKIELPPEMQMRLSRIQNVHRYAYDDDTAFFEKLINAKDLENYKD